MIGTKTERKKFKDFKEILRFKKKERFKGI